MVFGFYPNHAEAGLFIEKSDTLDKTHDLVGTRRGWLICGHSRDASIMTPLRCDGHRPKLGHLKFVDLEDP